MLRMRNNKMQALRIILVVYFPQHMNEIDAEKQLKFPLHFTQDR